MQTNQLDELSQNQKFISNQEEWQKLKNYEEYKFICQSCKKEFTVQKRSSRRVNQLRFLCKECGKTSTIKDKYGKSSLWEVDSINQKRRKTLQNHFGVNSPFESKTIRDKAKDTIKQRFGVDNVMYSDVVKSKLENTCMLRYVVRNVFASDEIRERGKQTSIRNWGTEHPMENKQVSTKSSKIRKERNPNFRVPYHKYKFNTETFDSSWELAFYIFYYDKGDNIVREPEGFKYDFQGQTHTYYPDFRLNGNLYEIKGDLFFKEGKLINPFDNSKNGISEAKHQCALQHGVIFITKSEIEPYLKYMQNTYGNKWQSKFKI